MYFYSDTSVSDFTHPIDFTRMNSTKKCLEHFSNLLTLTFILRESKDPLEKIQVTKEITICERKIKWWSHQPNYSHVEYMRGCEDLKKKWS